MKIAFLQSGMTGYQDACLRALRARGNEILNIFPTAYENANFDAESFRDYGRALHWPQDKPSAEWVQAAVDEFDPDAILMVSWRNPAYRKVMAQMRGRALRIMFSSNIWEGTYRQWLGRATHRVYLRPLYDCAFVPGDRSEWFVHRLGFSADKVIRGSNSADVEVFDRGARTGEQLAASRRFVFSGRLMPYKGIKVLREAYLRYRDTVEDPWDLDVVGLGELESEVAGLPGVTMHGFVSPQRLAELMHESACFVLPSYIDFFGVVVHEAAVAGQVLLCSDSVGATPYLLQDGYNGWTVATGDARSLADAMARVHALPPERLAAMSEGSRALSKRFSPTLWADNLTSEVERRCAALGLRVTPTARSESADQARPDAPQSMASRA